MTGVLCMIGFWFLGGLRGNISNLLGVKSSNFGMWMVPLSCFSSMIGPLNFFLCFLSSSFWSIELASLLSSSSSSLVGDIFIYFLLLGMGSADICLFSFSFFSSSLILSLSALWLCSSSVSGSSVFLKVRLEAMLEHCESVS